MSKSSPTDRQILANRLNAKKSTGPRSAEGRARASLNARKLGLFARDLLIPGEDSEQLSQHKVEMLKSLNPADALQFALAERIVEADWKIKRLRAAESALYNEHADALQQRHENQLAEAKEHLRDFRCACRGELDPDNEWAQSHPQESEKNRIKLAKLERKIAKAKSRAEQPSSAAEMTIDLLTDDPFKTPELQRLIKYQQQWIGIFNRCLNQLRQMKKEKAKPQEQEMIDFDESSDNQENENGKTNPIESQEVAQSEVVDAPVLPPLPSGEGWDEGAPENRDASEFESPLTLTLRRHVDSSTRRERGPEAD